MLSTNIVVVCALAYVALLFFVAFMSDARYRGSKSKILNSPWVYTLSISVYCTSWTFYGAVGSAGRNGLEFATIYLGPTFVFIGWWFLLRKMVRVGRVHRITSIADMISSRYGKSSTLAVLVTVIAVMATTPYIALQLKAVTASFEILSSFSDAGTVDAVGRNINARTAFIVAAGMAVFTILFGTRNIDANEHHHGVVAAIALEALVKLFALIAVGLFVVFQVAGGIGEVFELPAAAKLVHEDSVYGQRWIALTFLSATAILCLPRQFQVTVVENSDERHLATASWLFPLYLLLISLFILPIAIVGLSVLPAGSNPDMFVLTLPISQGQNALAILAFIGGFSSATSMIIVACIALSIMLSNHIVMPIALRLPRLLAGVSSDYKRLLLASRRVSIIIILFLGFIYFLLSARSDALASMGLIAFAGVAQFLPAMIGGLYWRHANRSGATTGLTLGFLLWAYCLVLPSLTSSGLISESFLSSGPWGITMLRPQALFSVSGLDPLVHALFWSLSLNVAGFIFVSLWREQAPLERIQGALFVDVFKKPEESESIFIHRSAPIDDLFVLAQRSLGPDEAYHLFSNYAQRQGLSGELPRPDAEFISHLERRIAGVIGAASARIMISQVASGETVSLDELVELVDETQQVIEYSQQLEEKSKELEETAAQLRGANERLRQLDSQKDDFLSQVSHEVRTPMTSIRSFAEILRNTDDLGADERQRFINIIHEESHRLTRLLDEILEMGSLEKSEFDWTVERVNAEEVMDRAVAICGGLASDSGVIINSGKRDTTAWVDADPDRLCQVLINLLSNAVKFNNAKAPEVSIKSESQGKDLLIYVEDNGPGIPEKDREIIFEKFSRSWESDSGGRAGSGLGLSISREIIRHLNGELDLLPTKSSGACFRIRLPLSND
jgi:Na+/proline symporter/nitrogen-specific signal transduction histidine kinase